MTCVLEAKDLSVAFTRYKGALGRERVVGLGGVSLSVNAGEVVAIIGQSGAGKSLFASALLGVLPKNAQLGGSMKLMGQPHDPTQAGERRIAWIPQSISYLDPLATVGSQVKWAARRCGATSVRSKVDIENILANVGLDASVAKLYPHELSGGMARRVLIAIATLGDPSVVVADEPTAGLDDVLVDLTLDLLAGLARRGMSLFVITHDLGSVLKIADRVAVFRDGRMDNIERAQDFREDGAALGGDYSRRLWRALPMNGFSLERADDA